MKYKNEANTTMNICYTDIYDMEELDNRRLYINNDIDNEIIDTIVYHILRFNRIDKDKKPEERKPILLYINSPGGDVYSGYGLISAMQDSITPIYTINQGMCASMAFLIFLAGSKRYSMRNSTFLMHDGSNGAFIESASKLRDRIEYETGQLEQLTKKFVLEQLMINFMMKSIV